MFGCVWASHYRSERQKMSENQQAHTIKLETNKLILLHQHNHQHNICITRLAMGLNTIRCMLFWVYSLTSFVDTSSYFSGFKNSVLFLFVSYYLFPLFCFVLFVTNKFGNTWIVFYAPAIGSLSVCYHVCESVKRMLYGIRIRMPIFHNYKHRQIIADADINTHLCVYDMWSLFVYSVVISDRR